MAVLANPYCTLKDLKARLSIDDHIDDGDLINAINVASRAIDDFCGTRFYASTETRTYTPVWNRRLDIDDLLSITSLKTDDDLDGSYETTWSSTDYKLYPRNSTVKRWIETTPLGLYIFPLEQDCVQVVGSFGFNTGDSYNAPPQIQFACLLLAQRIFMMRNIPFGVSANATLGQVTGSGLDADRAIMDILRSVRTKSPIITRSL